MSRKNENAPASTDPVPVATHGARKAAQKEDALVGPDDVAIAKIGRWGEYRNFECLACDFKTLNRDTALAHYQSEHAPAPPAPAPVEAVLLDRWGNAITEREG